MDGVAKEGRPKFNPQPGRGLNPGPSRWQSEILPTVPTSHKTKCLPSFMHHFSWCPSYRYCISHSTGISGAGLYDNDRKSVPFFRVFWWQTNLHEKFSFRFCKSSIYSLIFWFFAQMQKDLNEKRSCKYSRPFWILSRASKSSSFQGLLDHKVLQASWKSIDRVQSCCCKTGEENTIKLLKYISQQALRTVLVTVSKDPIFAH